MDTILVTGSAGFIGSSLSIKLVHKGFRVIGVDNLNSYYSVSLKKDRLKEIIKSTKFNKGKYEGFNFSIENINELEKLFTKYKPKFVVNLAAQAGVRYSLIDPHQYVQSNLVGFHNIIYLSKKYDVRNFIYASSSSVYGGNTNMPFNESQSVDHPVSFYAATKKCNEVIAHSYSHIYDLPTTGLRFFTVYGPWGRPDMAPMIFTKAILSGDEINIFNNGEMMRDFTYIDDVVDGIVGCVYKSAESSDNFNRDKPDPSISFAKHKIFNVGNGNPIKLMKFIELLELSIGKSAKKIFKPMQTGDVIATSANINKLSDWIGYEPKINLTEGIGKFVKWYKEYVRI
ncbi:Putative nucleotide sugar epimerase [Prochlorococcus marinus subsp. pastoris str. CCMP1986]|uniref:Putative nucleotide sugar epimerase n=1 Tax=Prochlorococcus marinus subsp. pastoris (strain CCMP1986 / NIES-2087 / MED4) TaxID=59919 RepID=Q7V0P6_PROMP|nr:NAD-dependent epimerase/dehydratase family protein [Prochlorococcus marinus]KGF87230.1 UDP-glucose 4-epimerase [Prochlorococcus marinus str. EQPAC1]CAE19669.1 Putative nucleotide sugar epimerase [Prochlorococcus marinus subsp. pastoris str. CCMP1986]